MNRLKHAHFVSTFIISILKFNYPDPVCVYTSNEMFVYGSYTMKIIVLVIFLVALLSGCLIDGESKTSAYDPEVVDNCIYVDSLTYCTESSAGESIGSSVGQQEEVMGSSVASDPIDESSSDYWLDENDYSYEFEEVFPEGEQCIGGLLWDTQRDMEECQDVCIMYGDAYTRGNKEICYYKCQTIYYSKNYEEVNKEFCLECTGFVGRDSENKPTCIEDCDGYIVEGSEGFECVSEAEITYKVEEYYTSNDTTYSVGMCRDADIVISSYIEETPVYQPYDEYLVTIINSDNIEIETPGKIYQIDSLKFVVDTENGVHIYNTSDARNPVHIAFIVIPGVQDVAVKNKTLFADSYSTFLAIDITDPTAITVLKDIPEVLTVIHEKSREVLTKELGFIVGWENDTLHHVSCKMAYWKNDRDDKWPYFGSYGIENGGWVDASGGGTGSGTGDGSGSGGNAPTIGMGGSLARFAVSEEYLYAVTESELVTFWITDETDPKYSNRSEIGWWGIETVYMKQNLLFVGSRDAMYIYDISNAGNPKQASRFSHVTSCDPVVVEGDYAYVTLRTGSGCNTGDTELEILDVSDIYNPFLSEAYEMHNPAGLGIWDNRLYICDGSAGLKVYDMTNTPDLTLVNIVDTINVFDLIVNESGLTLIGDAGIYQYDHSDPANLELLSFIPAE